MNDFTKAALSRRDLLAAAGLCGGAALAAGSLALAQGGSGAAIPVAFLLDTGATIIDFCGPWEVFQDAGVAGVAGFDLFTVAPRAGPIETSGGMQIMPRYTVDNAPEAKIIIIPAQGNGADGSTAAPKVAWLRERFARADLIMSVCTGAFLLARTGLLDGLTATTHHDFYAQFEQSNPNVRLIRGRRFVEHPKLLTAGGLSSGIDAALHVV